MAVLIVHKSNKKAEFYGVEIKIRDLKALMETLLTNSIYNIYEDKRSIRDKHKLIYTYIDIAENLYRDGMLEIVKDKNNLIQYKVKMDKKLYVLSERFLCWLNKIRSL